MLTYWKITFTIALVAVLVGAVDRWVDRWAEYRCYAVRDLLLLAFMSFVCIGLSVEVWA